jgi:hypothetical protein
MNPLQVPAMQCRVGALGLATGIAAILSVVRTDRTARNKASTRLWAYGLERIFVILQPIVKFDDGTLHGFFGSDLLFRRWRFGVVTPGEVPEETTDADEWHDYGQDHDDSEGA